MGHLPLQHPRPVSYHPTPSRWLRRRLAADVDIRIPLVLPWQPESMDLRGRHVGEPRTVACAAQRARVFKQRWLGIRVAVEAVTHSNDVRPPQPPFRHPGGEGLPRGEHLVEERLGQRAGVSHAAMMDSVVVGAPLLQGRAVDRLAGLWRCMPVRSQHVLRTARPSAGFAGRIGVGQPRNPADPTRSGRTFNHPSVFRPEMWWRRRVRVAGEAWWR